MKMEVKIRRAQPGDQTGIAHVHVESWRSTYKGIVSDKVLENLSMEEREKSWKQAIEMNQILYVALNDKEEIVGFATGGKSRSTEYPYDGELYAIYLLEEYQQQGIGRRLINSISNELKLLNYQSMIVWVLRDNPSKQAYEKLGAKVFDSKEIQIGRDSLVEDVLVWETMDQFIGL